MISISNSTFHKTEYNQFYTLPNLFLITNGPERSYVQGSDSQIPHTWY